MEKLAFVVLFACLIMARFGPRLGWISKGQSEILLGVGVCGTFVVVLVGYLMKS